MSQIAKLETRVTRLEERMDDVHKLASGTDQEVAGWQRTLKNHTDTLNAIREDQVDQGKKLANLEKKVDEGFAKVDENFAKVEEKFKLLHEGQDKITKLLTRHLDEPDDGTHAGGADE